MGAELKIWTLAAMLAASGVVAQPAAAASEAAAKFGAREMVEDVSISPDGNSIALIQPTMGRGSVLYIVNLNGAPELKPILSSSGSPERLTDCRWSTATRLICGLYLVESIGGDPRAYSRLVSLNSDGSDLKPLSARASSNELGVAMGGGNVIDWLGDDKGAVLMTRTYVPEQSTGTLTTSQKEGLGVDRVDTTTLSRKLVETPRPAASEYISDGHGTVRVMGVQPDTNTGMMGNRTVYTYRKKGSRDWLPLSTVTYDGSLSRGFSPYAVDPDLDVVYGFDNESGRTALFKISLDGTLKRELVYERPDVDVHRLIQIGRQNRVVGVGYTAERQMTAFFDPALKAFAASLSKALPGKPLVSFVDASADEKKLLLWAGSDTDPGRFYLYNRDTKGLTEIMAVRPQLEKTPLATVKPIAFPAADGTMIPGYLTLPPGSDGKNLPAIVLPHGGPEARDEWTFDWLPQFFANRGYAVLQPNYRGSTGYGAAWFQENGYKSWRTAIGDVDDGGRWLVKQGIAAPDKMAIVGWSYGGYAALQSAVHDPGLFKAVAAVAPVTDLVARVERAKRYTDYKLVEARTGTGPNAVQGSPARNAERIQVPVLLFHGDLDVNVEIEQSRIMESRLKAANGKVEFVEYKGLDHHLVDDKVRTEMLDKIDTFLRTSMNLGKAAN
ncbi:MAG: S9 family peptidase [Sphingomonas sp.]|jgi:dipeptidyl aminopeptidase/acylaminoacyl peptidase|uniref:alpha/beta hydrolase family protein n=1 Tax=Sphingomonas sp. TaxID=28214 RepID=UPI0035612F5B